MVKLLGVVGSPRKGGNTATIMQEALKAGAQEGAETRMVYLVDFNLEPCNGCRTCFQTQDCVIKDDAEKLLKEMEEADGIIIGSPVYFYNVTAQTKTFMDKVGYLLVARGRKALRHKIGGAIAVAGRSGLTSALSQILLFYSSARMIVANPVVPSLASAKGDANQDKQGLEYARELGKTITRIAKATTHLGKA